MRRIAILADIHGNAPALTAVLADAQRHECNEYWFLGDIFGYGPLPVNCIYQLDAVSPVVWLMGNHDFSVMRLWQGANPDDESIHQMTPSIEQRWVAQWHAAQVQVGLPNARAQVLASLPTWTEVSPGIFAAHGAILDENPHASRNIDANSYVKPWKPVADTMLNSVHQWRDAIFPYFIAVGHYHQPMLGIAQNSHPPYDIHWIAGASVYDDETESEGQWNLPTANEEKTIIINPGSVGQPRFVEGDSRAAYAILEVNENKTGTMSFSNVIFRRIDYNERLLRAAQLTMPPKQSEYAQKWWNVIDPILDEWIQQESSHEA